MGAVERICTPGAAAPVIVALSGPPLETRLSTPVSPRERVTTSAPLATPQLMPSAIPSSVPVASVPITRTGMIFESGAVPAIPIPLPVAAAAIPAT